MVFSPARLNLTWHYSQVVLLVWIALLSLPQRWAEGQKMVQEMEGATFYTALILGLDPQEPQFCSLLLWIFCLFFSSPFFSTPFLPPKYSLEQGLETWDSFPVNVPVTIARVSSDPVNICVQSRKSSWGILHPLVRGAGLGSGLSLLGELQLYFWRGWGVL